MNEPLRVFIASPYTAGDPERNVRRALAVADLLLELDFAPFVPVLSHYWDALHSHPYEVWMRLSLAWVEASDVVFRLKGESLGADRECEFADELGIPVFLTLEALLEWRRLEREHEESEAISHVICAHCRRTVRIADADYVEGDGEIPDRFVCHACEAAE